MLTDAWSQAAKRSPPVVPAATLQGHHHFVAWPDCDMPGAPHRAVPAPGVQPGAAPSTPGLTLGRLGCMSHSSDLMSQGFCKMVSAGVCSSGCVSLSSGGASVRVPTQLAAARALISEF